MASRNFNRLMLAADTDQLELGDAVTEARATLAAVTVANARHNDELPAGEGERRRAAAQRVLTAPDQPVDVDDVLAARAALEVHQLRAAVLNDALTDAQQDFVDAVADNAATIITAIDARGQELWQSFTKTVRDLGDLDLSVGSPDQLLRAPDTARRAYLTSQDLAAVYGRLRNALSDVPQPTVEQDYRGCHGELEQGYCQAIDPGWYGSAMSEQKPRPPWGEWADQLGRLVWLARQGCTPWFASSSARDEAWKRAHGEQAAAMAQQRQRHWQATAR